MPPDPNSPPYQGKVEENDPLPPPPNAFPLSAENPGPDNAGDPASRCKSIKGMTHEEKMKRAIESAARRNKIAPELLRNLPSPQDLAIGIVAIGAILAGLGFAAGAVASTGVGAVLEAIAAAIVIALTAAGVITSGAQVIGGIATLMQFYDETRCDKAETQDQLDAAGDKFGQGAGKAGAGVINGILTYFGARGGKGLFKWGKGKGTNWRLRRNPPPPPPPPPPTIYTGVEIVDSNGSPLGEFDQVVGDLKFIEDKSAQGLNILNPKTGKPAQTPDEWAQKQIFDETVVRINNLLKNAVATRPTVGGSSTVPSLSDIQGIRALEFKIEATSNPALEAAVNKQLAALKAMFPTWTFTATYGP